MNRTERESLRPILECLSAVALGAVITVLIGLVVINARAIEEFFNNLAANLFK